MGAERLEALNGAPIMTVTRRAATGATEAVNDRGGRVPAGAARRKDGADER